MCSDDSPEIPVERGRRDKPDFLRHILHADIRLVDQLGGEGHSIGKSISLQLGSAIEYVDKNYPNNFKIADLANECHMSYVLRTDIYVFPKCPDIRVTLSDMQIICRDAGNHPGIKTIHIILYDQITIPIMTVPDLKQIVKVHIIYVLTRCCLR